MGGQWLTHQMHQGGQHGYGMGQGGMGGMGGMGGGTGMGEGWVSFLFLGFLLATLGVSTPLIDSSECILIRMHSHRNEEFERND
jgi:hypothetical protein